MLGADPIGPDRAVAAARQVFAWSNARNLLAFLFDRLAENATVSEDAAGDRVAVLGAPMVVDRRQDIVCGEWSSVVKLDTVPDRREQASSEVPANDGFWHEGDLPPIPPTVRYATWSGPGITNALRLKSGQTATLPMSLLSVGFRTHTAI